ncbi:MAG: TlpA family protein disulfide reductase [Candidatus Azotimanducaceae bacterium]|uniref:TlpA family protein disulfide reductase n=1 Tax=OM182 bacterium TaxID=2510334 RepID=A0A520S4T7_9GAMM|nr:thioredoxin [Gammaproteobacteria bacterium]OUV68280.1 MAG: hypothetical protein CBC93_02835 [Gammaproteobacteria bacterium TMED133]RZO77454.1 MAG: TlpA family protein disulfide reductase [OM182 bacterium]
MPRTLFFLFYLLLASCEKADFYDSHGGGHFYEDLAGKWVVINYWATWCGPCHEEIPEFNRLARAYPTSLKVFGVNFEPVDPDVMEEHVKEMGITFPVYSGDPYEHFGYERPLVLPTTIVISPEGSIHSELVGPQTRDSILAIIDSSSL